MTLTHEEYYEAQEHAQSIRDVQLSEIEAETKVLVGKYSVNTNNEVLAQIAFESFCDGCAQWDIPGAEDEFDARFPELAVYCDL